MASSKDLRNELRLAIDIGGTFTDTVLMEGEEGVLASAKTLTTHANPADGAMEGANRVIKAAGRSFGQVTGFIHGTTLATNALIEKRGAEVATITTDGFRDILEIAYERRYAQYDINLEKPDFLVPRERSLTVRERMSAAGEVLVPLDASAAGRLAEKIGRIGAQSVAICLLHAYANGEHERTLRDGLLERRPDLSISLSSETSPEAREFDRLSTTVANAYIKPLIQGYLERFSARFGEAGLTCPILMMTAGGGMCTLNIAAQFPVRLVESGPAGGAILAARIAGAAGEREVLSFDMGGTTAKLCLIDKYRPQTSRKFEIARAARFIKGSGMPVRIPVIEMIEIGAGGGSIASVDRLGRLGVGPQSAGSEPGPVAFKRGGKQPTVTDSDITLGYIVPGEFAEGHIEIDPKAAAQSLAEAIGAKIGTDHAGAADGVSRIVDESMASAGRMHGVESGKELATRTMIAFGGNGPLHATRVARSAGIGRIIIPPNPGVGSAIGFLYAPVSFEIVRSHYALLASIDLTAINGLVKSMVEEASAVVALGTGKNGIEGAQIHRSAFMRYRGQGHEIEIPIDGETIVEDDIPGLVSAFEEAYRKQFSRPVPNMQIEILNWSVRVATAERDAAPVQETKAQRDVVPSQQVTIICDIDGTECKAALVHRSDLCAGDTITGPALVVEPQTTTLVSADFTALADGAGNLVLTRILQQEMADG
ncbi:hydantoinase/oxoprolinase family protein [Salaquimonas pukyongi]|uniref:hydantoinase/oxoprolinase family protein n=1 Tax=Salaquimonas pukyongi TaxID=2712698 RepID=UPI00096B7F89|nr:hydantoinase/oxoprolinase family protein [Salaquimonas pukyongi]